MVQAPGVEVARDVIHAPKVEVRVTDRGDALDGVDGPEDKQQHARQGNPAGAAIIVRYRSGPETLALAGVARTDMEPPLIGSCESRRTRLNPHDPAGQWARQ